MAVQALPRTYIELVLRSEIERALNAGNTFALAALDRVRDAAGCAPDHRVSERLQQQENRHVTR